MTAASCLDLRGVPCPLNYVRSRLALEKVPIGAWLWVELDQGEPDEMVCNGLQSEGQHVERCSLQDGAIRLMIRRDCA